MEIQQVWSSDFKTLESNLMLPESWPHPLAIHLKKGFVIEWFVLNTEG